MRSLRFVYSRDLGRPQTALHSPAHPLRAIGPAHPRLYGGEAPGPDPPGIASPWLPGGRNLGSYAARRRAGVLSLADNFSVQFRGLARLPYMHSSFQ